MDWQFWLTWFDKFYPWILGHLLLSRIILYFTTPKVYKNSRCTIIINQQSNLDIFMTYQIILEFFFLDLDFLYFSFLF